MTMKLRILFHVLFFGVLRGASSSSSSSSSEEEQSGGHSKGTSHEHWGYDDQESWSSAFKHCSGTSQSPIDIDTDAVTFDPSLLAITLDGYDLTNEHAGLTLFNNGHTLQLKLPESLQIVSGFDTTFLAAQLHFHWGTVAVPGSEHTIDQVHFPAELHIVHYNSKYAGLAEAASQPDGLAVLGAFIGIGLHENKDYEKILAALTDVSIEESNTEIPGFNVRHLLPNDLRRFYRYTGSLTTPPCFQTVTWTLFNDTVSLSRRQMAALEESLKADQSRKLNKNFRVPQLLHGRSVLASFTATSSPGGVSPAYNDGSKAAGIDVRSSTGVQAIESLWERKSDILAVAFGILFAVTLLILTVFWCRQRKTTHTSVRKESWQNVTYKQAKTQDV